MSIIVPLLSSHFSQLFALVKYAALGSDGCLGIMSTGKCAYAVTHNYKYHIVVRCVGWDFFLVFHYFRSHTLHGYETQKHLLCMKEKINSDTNTKSWHDEVFISHIVGSHSN